MINSKTRALLVCFLFVCLAACGHKPINIKTPKHMPQPKPLGNINIALVLGGGGSRGVAHAGVLSVLEEQGIPIDLVVGTSVGSAMGALYCADPNSEALQKKVTKLTKWDLLDLNIQTHFRMLWGIGGLVEGHALRAFLVENLEQHHFEQLKIPLAVVTTDVEEGKLFVIRSGPIIPAVHASSAIPLVFEPVTLYQRVLVDGGVMSPVPVEVAKSLGAKKVIAVDIGAVIKPQKVYTTYQVAERSLWLSYIALTSWQTHHADVLIQPKFNTSSMFDDTQLNAYYTAGRMAALDALPQIRALMEEKVHLASSQ